MLWIILGIIAVLVLWAVFAYNGLVRLKTYTEEAWSQISVQLKRRNDLIPNLVETVKGYTKHEEETLEKVIQARNQLTQVNAGNGSPQEVMDASTNLSTALKSVFALSEAYPDLKANTNFLELQEELTNTENKIAYARQLYNSSVSNYNIQVKSIPTNIIAGIAGFRPEKMIEIPEEETAVPTVSF